MNDPRFDPCEITYHHSRWPPSKTPQIKMIKEDTIFYFSYIFNIHAKQSILWRFYALWNKLLTF